MKYIKPICCAILLLASLSAFGLSETTDGVTWYYSVVDGNARVTSVSPSSGTVTMPSKLGGYNVTSIGDEAFRNCSGLTGITIPGSVTSIGTSAFRDSGLMSVTIGNGVRTIGNSAFYGCRGLNGVTIPNSVVTIDNFAFYDCDNLTEVKIPNSVTSIGPSAFASCGGLLSVTLGNSITRIGSYAFRYCSQLVAVRFEGNCPATIGDNVFTGVASDCCAYVTRSSMGWGVTIPGTWRGLSIDWAQYIVRFNANGGTCTTSSIGVERGKAIGTLPVPTWDSATFIGWFTGSEGGTRIEESTLITDDMTLYAHWELHANVWLYDLRNGEATITKYSSPEGAVLIPDEIDGYPVVAIEAKAFSGCTNLTGVILPDSVTSIGYSAFDGCSNLVSVVIGDGVTSVGSYAFRGTPFYNNLPDGLVVFGRVAYEMRGNCPSIVTIPDGVAIIGSSVFSGCSGLTGVTIPNSVTNIGNYAFQDCSGLTSVTIPDGVTSIGYWAFGGCSGLTRVTIPNSVTNIGTYAFSGCSGLIEITVGEANTVYKSENGLLLSKDGKTLIQGINGNVTIPDSVTSIVNSAFSGCSGLTSVTIPNSVTSIGSSAFSGCSGLTSVTIPECVCASNTLVSMFSSARGQITDVTIADGTTMIGDGAFGTSRFLRLSHLTSIAIPNSVTAIATNAFAYCDKLTSVTIPQCVCTNKLSVVFPSSYQSITNVIIADGVALTIASRRLSSFFSGCTNITSMTIPASVTISGLTIPAVWRGITIDYIRREVTFDPNDGMDVIATSNIVDGTTLEVFPTPTHEDAVFGGWFTDAEGGDEVVAPLTVTASIALYAHWIPIHEVTFDPNGGICVIVSSNVVDGTVLGVLPTPTCKNSFFLGWFTDAEGGDEVVAPLTVTASIALYAHWLEVAPPVVISGSGNPFRTESSEVSITCAIDGATIYYADDGTTPKIREEYLYTGPLTITDTTAIKAVAVFGGIKSRYETVTITKKPLTMDEVLDIDENMTVATSEANPWRPILDPTAKVGDATARSGMIGNRTNTWLSATVSGAGTMTFWCKTSCEHDEDGTFMWDRLMVYTNGVEIVGWRMDGETDWTQRELTFAGGENTVKWVYYKDKSGAEGEDCAWVDGVTWTPSGAAAGLESWLVGRGLTADARAANGRTAAECYALGLDPEDNSPTNDFRIVSIEMVDGVPHVEWEPKVNRWTGAEINAVLKGATGLDDEFVPVTEANKSSFRFFKVTVELP